MRAQMDKAGLEEVLLGNRDEAAPTAASVIGLANRQLNVAGWSDVWLPLSETAGNDFGPMETARAIPGRQDGVFVIKGLSLMVDAARLGRTAIFSSPLKINAGEVHNQIDILNRGKNNQSTLSAGERIAFQQIERLSQRNPDLLMDELVALARRRGADWDAAQYVAAIFNKSGALCGHFSYPGSRQPIREPIHGIERIQASDLEPIFGLIERGRLKVVTRIDPSRPIYVARELDLRQEDNQYRVRLRKIEADGKTAASPDDVVVGETKEEAGLLTAWKGAQTETTEFFEKYGDNKSPDYKKPGAYRRVEAARVRERKARRDLLSAVVRRIYGSNASFRNIVLEDYLGGDAELQRLLEIAQGLKREDQFARLVRDGSLQRSLKDLADRLGQEIAREKEEQERSRQERRFREVADLHTMRNRLAKLQDIMWEIEQEALELIERVRGLIVDPEDPESRKPLTQEEMAKLSDGTLRELLAFDTVFSAFDRNMESRGRDSLGVTATYQFGNKAAYEAFRDGILTQEERGEFERRSNTEQTPNLVNRTILVREDPSGRVSVTLVYKTAQLVGRLGDNVTRLKQEMVADRILQKMMHRVESMKLAHTRWASAGIISVENAHPQSNQALYTIQIDGQNKTFELIFQIPVTRTPYGKSGNILVVLNGDITNYARSELLGDQYFPNLLREFVDRPLPEDVIRKIAEEITTDAKIIPLVIEEFLARGHTLQEAFRHAVRRFAGSFSIQMVSDLEPDKVFVARGGDGQGLYIGISPDSLIPASEPMGFVRRTNRYVNIEPYTGKEPVPGQPDKKRQFETPVIAVIDRNEPPTVENIHLYRADNGASLPLTEEDVESTPATMRDIALGDNPSFFIKEVFGAADMFESTIEGRVIIQKRSDGKEAVEINLEEEQLPKKVVQDLKDGKIRKVILTAMGTAEAAGMAGEVSIKEDLERAGFKGTVETLSSIELGQFALENDMSDTLIFAVSQSGATKDTNAALREAQKRGAVIIAVVNKRDSETVFIARRSGGGVYYTGTGRDIEIAVASTKAYYAQIGALSVLGMGIAQAMGLPEEDEVLVSNAFALLEIPNGIRKVLGGVPKTLPEDPKAVFDPGPDEHPIVRATYAMQRQPNGSIAGDGPGALSAHEGGIKFRELNYVTINIKDSVADVKHEDTAAEGWQLWLAANVRGVSGNYWKDVVIGELEKMIAHRNPVILVATEKEAGQHLLDRNGQPKYKVKWERPDGTTFQRPIDLIFVPETNERFAPIYHALVAHLISYHNALRTNRISQMVAEAHHAVRETWDQRIEQGLYPEQIVTEQTFQQTVQATFKPVFELRTRHGIHFPLPGHLQGVWDDLRTMVDRLQGNGSYEDEVEYQGKWQPFIAVFSDRAGRIRQELARGIDSIRHQAKFVAVGIEVGGQLVSSVLLPLSDRLEQQGLFSETINAALGMYLNYLRDERSRVHLIEDPFDAPSRSRLVVVASGGAELQRVVLGGIDRVSTKPPVAVKSVSFRNEEGTEFLIVEVTLDQPVSPQLAGSAAAGLEEQQAPPLVEVVLEAIYRHQLEIVEEVGNWLVTKRGVLIGKPGTAIGVNLANLHPRTIRENVEPGVVLVGQNVVVEAGAVIGRGTYVENARVGRDARVGAGSVLIWRPKNHEEWRLSPEPNTPYVAGSVPTEVGEGASLGEGTFLFNFKVGRDSVWARAGTYPNIGMHGQMGERVRAMAAKIVLARIEDDSLAGNFEGNFEKGQVTGPLEITDFIGRPGQKIGQAGRSDSFYVEYVEGFSLPPLLVDQVGSTPAERTYRELAFMSTPVVFGDRAIALEFSGTLKPGQTELQKITGSEKSAHGILAFGFGGVLGGGSKLIGVPDVWTRDGVVTAGDVFRRYSRTYLGHFAVLAPPGFRYITADRREREADR